MEDSRDRGRTGAMNQRAAGPERPPANPVGTETAEATIDNVVRFTKVFAPPVGARPPEWWADMSDAQKFEFAVRLTAMAQGLDGIQLNSRSMLVTTRGGLLTAKSVLENPGASRKHAVNCIREMIPIIDSMLAVEQPNIDWALTGAHWEDHHG